MSVRTNDPRPAEIFEPALCTAGCGKPYESICGKCNLAFCMDHLKGPHACETYPAVKYVPSPPPVPVDPEETEFLAIYAKVVAKAREFLAEAYQAREGSDDWPATLDWNALVGTSKSIFMYKAREALGISHDGFLHIVREWPYSGEGKEELDRMFGA
jgi:hypothetical protein